MVLMRPRECRSGRGYQGLVSEHDVTLGQLGKTPSYSNVGGARNYGIAIVPLAADMSPSESRTISRIT